MDELADVRDGTHDSPKPTDGGKYLITSRHIKNGKITFENAYKISSFDFENINKRSKVDKFDILFSMIGTIGEKAIVNFEPSFAIKNVGLFKTGDEFLSKWIYYYLNSSSALEEIDARKKGSTQEYIALGDLRSFPVRIPKNATVQRSILTILSSLDDKIDLLHRQNKTLEAMAQTLFRQWFVEEADEEWEERPLSFFGNIICGKTPSKARHEYFNGEIPFIKIPDMHGSVYIFSTNDSLTLEGAASQANKMLDIGAICVSCIATVGLVSMTTQKSQTNQQINSIVPYDKTYRYYLFLALKNMYEDLNIMASGGTATLNLNTGDFSKISIPFPRLEDIKNFHEAVEPLFTKILSNTKQIRTLAKLRDTLLPKLMSGEVRVEEK